LGYLFTNAVVKYNLHRRAKEPSLKDGGGEQLEQLERVCASTIKKGVQDKRKGNTYDQDT